MSRCRVLNSLRPIDMMIAVCKALRLKPPC